MQPTPHPTPEPTPKPTPKPTPQPTPEPTRRGDECSTAVECITVLESNGRDIDCPACENGHCVSKPSRGCSDEYGCCNLSDDKAECSAKCDGADFCFQRDGDDVGHCPDPTCSVDVDERRVLRNGLPECGA